MASSATPSVHASNPRDINECFIFISARVAFARDDFRLATLSTRVAYALPALLWNQYRKALPPRSRSLASSLAAYLHETNPRDNRAFIRCANDLDTLARADFRPSILSTSVPHALENCPRRQ